MTEGEKGAVESGVGLSMNTAEGVLSTNIEAHAKLYDNLSS